MKTTIHSFMHFAMVSWILCVVGCETSNVCVSGEATQTLSMNTQALTAIQFPGDKASEEACDAIEMKLKRGDAIRMDLYSYEWIHSVEGGKASILAESNQGDRRGDWYERVMGNATCLLNAHSGYETCAYQPAKEPPVLVERSALKPNAFYAMKASNYLEKDLDALSSAHFKYALYKNKVGVQRTLLGESSTAEERIFDVGIGYTASLDGWPVIGPGAKAYVYMTPAGDLISKTVFKKVPTKALARLTEKDLKTPEEALEELYLDPKIDLKGYGLTKREFGYFVWGKNSIQNIVAPHYVFFFSPENSEFDTGVYHIVSAVKGAHADLIQADRELETQRKLERMGDKGHEADLSKKE